MRVYVLGTGSSGNALLVEDDGTRILVEAGIGPKNAVLRLRDLGADLFPRGVDGVVVTHHHNDHCAQLESLAKALHAPRAGERGTPMLHLHDGVDVPRVRHRYGVRRYRAGQSFEVRGLRVRTLTVAHDAPHVAIAIQSKTHTLGFLTDVGSVSSAVADFLSSCDTVLMESNFCPDLLEMSRYPRPLKQRIAGHLGHLSNQQAAGLASAISRAGTSRLFLCHLSQSNNEPEIALRTVRERAPDLPIEVLGHGRSRVIDLAPKTRHTYEQLPLF